MRVTQALLYSDAEEGLIASVPSLQYLHCTGRIQLKLSSNSVEKVLTHSHPSTIEEMQVSQGLLYTTGRG